MVGPEPARGQRSEGQPSSWFPCPHHTHLPLAFDSIHIMCMWLSCSLFFFLLGWTESSLREGSLVGALCPVLLLHLHLDAHWNASYPLSKAQLRCHRPLHRVSLVAYLPVDYIAAGIQDPAQCLLLTRPRGPWLVPVTGSPTL